MKTYWLTFTDGSQGSCQGESPHDAKKIAEKVSGKTVKGGEFHDIDARPLPYPAAPVIWKFAHPAFGSCPDFCYEPKKCAGRTACPQPYACSE